MEISLAPSVLPLIYLPIHTFLVLRSSVPIPGKRRVTGINLALFVFFLGQVLWGKDLSADFAAVRIILLWSPIVFFWFGYLWAGLTLKSIHGEGRFFDRPIARFEEKYLGHPSLYWGRNRPRLITEIFHLGYFSYYFYTLSLGLYFDISGRWDEFQAMSFATNFGYLFSYICYTLIPVAGPRWFLVEDRRLKESEIRQPGYLFTRLTHMLLFGGPAHKGGAMPSSHSSTALIFLCLTAGSWGLLPGLAALVLVGGMWIGAVYGRYHYLTDVAAGILLGAFGILLSRFLVDFL